MLLWSDVNVAHAFWKHILSKIGTLSHVQLTYELHRADCSLAHGGNDGVWERGSRNHRGAAFSVWYQDLRAFQVHRYNPANGQYYFEVRSQLRKYASCKVSSPLLDKIVSWSDVFHRRLSARTRIIRCSFHVQRILHRLVVCAAFVLVYMDLQTDEMLR